MCGMTRSEDVNQAIQLGVDAIGVIFYPKSSRYVSLAQAKTLLRDVPPFIDVVAVLVNPEKDFVRQIMGELPIQFLQFHGEESPAFCQQFLKPFIKAMHADSEAHIEKVVGDFSGASAFLLDTPSTQARGGTGLTFNWDVIPKHLAKPYLLAGGLNEANVLAAIHSCHPYAVDLCSGVEAAPGVKDYDKMSRFMRKVHEYNLRSLATI